MTLKQSCESQLCFWLYESKLLPAFTGGEAEMEDLRDIFVFISYTIG